ncbi:hypothetical protein [Stakelama saccharophila]|uniref:Uncharacterized protein n=1 Tax=Stakelama saccharophila TaxID=3075605 RepID=A0ABZ0B8J5_9SPHN|nr:hypothetical protein [Stakelama sp. W311]WNO53431.1 hypothetical protein RPR59_13450 [Stakelama sp. W311]
MTVDPGIVGQHVGPAPGFVDLGEHRLDRSGALMSAFNPSACTPAPVNCLTSISVASGATRQLIATRAPSPANALAIAAPSRELPPAFSYGEWRFLMGNNGPEAAHSGGLPE